MKEKLIDIVNAIAFSFELRKRSRINAIARVHCFIDNVEKTYWFTPNTPMTGLCKEYHLDAFGEFVPKNSYVAIKLQTSDVGTSFEYNQKNIIKRVQKHIVRLENRSDLQNRKISIAGDKLQYQYRDIYEFQKTLRENEKKIIANENEQLKLSKQIDELKKQVNTAHQREELTKSLNKTKEAHRILTQQQAELKYLSNYIRKQGEMRYNPIIDPIQTRIKSQNLFDGKTIIINGGPGTGKTTTMIHRLGYLTDTFAINEDEELQANNYKLNKEQRRNLIKAINEQRDWMFFSPSKLLKDYLAEAMKKEGLTNIYQKVWNWKEYCKNILQINYRLLDSARGNAPFVNSNNKDVLFLPHSSIVKELSAYFVEQLSRIKNKLPKLTVEGNIYEWMSIALGIQNRFDGSENYELSNYISLFNSLEQVYGDDCKRILRENRNRIKTITDDICELLEKENDVKSELDVILDISLDDEDEENEDDDYADIEGANYIYNAIRQWVRQYGYCMVCKSAKLTYKQEMMSEWILLLIGEKYDAQFQRIGELVLFEQYAKYTNGFCSVFFSGFAGKYKRFRRHLQKKQFEGCNLSVLRELIQEGKELHHQEQSLIVGFINNTVKQIKMSGNRNVKHVFVEAYEELARPIIGVDEATDFCECDIYAIDSLLTLDFNSLTLCGDMMQRLTEDGITSWEDLNGIVSNPTVVEMKTSYRQSVKLLDVARHLYIDTIGTKPNYTSYMTSNKVPAPLVCVSEDERTKVLWMAKRIEEVYCAYGEQLPSIAIFVNDKGDSRRLIEILKETNFISSNKIDVVDGVKENSQRQENHIRVYPIDIVKGLEFDVVFFHNIDRYYVSVDAIKRYIYVGVSRAAFFLGITLNEWNDDLCKYFEIDKDWFKIQ